MSTTLVIPAKLGNKVQGLAKSKGVPVEELVITALDEAFKLLNPREKAEVYLELCDKYLSEAEEFLRERNGVQASEKGWGAAAQVVKALAASEGRDLKAHRALWEYVAELREKYHDEEISALWRGANALHINFYENWMPIDEVGLAMKDVKRLVKKVKGLIHGDRGTAGRGVVPH